MKVRNGFVSNSSSSSFIVILDKKPESAEELGKEMGDCGTSNWNGTQHLSSEMVHDIAFRDISVADSTMEQIESEYKSAMYRYNWDVKWGTPEYDAYEKAESERCEKLWQEFKEKNSKKFMAVVSYSDDYTIGSMMEHGDVFRNIEVVCASHH